MFFIILFLIIFQKIVARLFISYVIYLEALFDMLWHIILQFYLFSKVLSNSFSASDDNYIYLVWSQHFKWSLLYFTKNLYQEWGNEQFWVAIPESH